MGSIFVHASVGLLGYIFQGIYSLPFLASALFPDLEYFFIGIYELIKTKQIRKTVDVIAKTGILHSILGTIFISLPILYLVFSGSGNYIYLNLFLSILLGLMSHLILDLPAHPTLMLLWPFKKIEKNPFLIRWRNPLIKRLYPYKKLEVKPFQYIAEYHWSIISMIIPLILLLIYALK